MLFDIPHNYAGGEQFSFTPALLYTQAVGLYAFLSIFYNARVTASNISENRHQGFNITSLNGQQVV